MSKKMKAGVVYPDVPCIRVFRTPCIMTLFVFPHNHNLMFRKHFLELLCKTYQHCSLRSSISHVLRLV